MKRSILAAVVLCAFASCSRQQQPPAADAARPAPAHAPTSAAAAAAGTSVTGPVLETMDAASYTYVRVRGDSGEVWAAAPQFPVKVGDQVRVPLEMPMKDFHSTSLNRDFPLIYFVSRITPAGASDQASASSPDSVHGAQRGQAATVTTPMAPPAGGMTIASLWNDRKALAGKSVTIHGVVVKYNAGILGVNWIHLQDGTGKAADGSNDVTVTATEAPGLKVGDTVVATGTVVLDKNIGQGYAYPVLVENARVSAVTKTTGS
jgi:hypothetical protein